MQSGHLPRITLIMRRYLFPSVFFLLCASAACAPSAPPAQEPSQPPAAAPAAATPVEQPAVAKPAAPPEPEKAAAPSPEEAKKAEEAERQRQLAERIAAATKNLEETYAKESARWTDDLRKRTAKLTKRRFWNTKVALRAALASPHRVPGNADRDKYRHPIQTMAFFGLKPNHTVIEIGPGAGWYTELLAAALAGRGKLVIPVYDTQSDDPVTAFVGTSMAMLLDKSPELFGKVERIVNPDLNGELILGSPGSADMILVIRGMHGWHGNKVLARNLAACYQALKPGGVLGVVQHRANTGDNADDSTKRGYLPQPWLIEQIKAAGFELSGKSEVNANPKDTKDHPSGVWTLPPTLTRGDEDKDKYLAIGESDRMTLRFVKKK